MPCHAMSCHAMPCHAMPYHAMPCHVMPCHVMPCHGISTMSYHTSKFDSMIHVDSCYLLHEVMPSMTFRVDSCHCVISCHYHDAMPCHAMPCNHSCKCFTRHCIQIISIKCMAAHSKSNSRAMSR